MASAPPRDLSQDGPPVAAPPEPQQVAPQHPPSGVAVSDLGDIDGPAVGLLDDTNGGLGRQMWVGSDHGVIEDLLSRIPADSNSSPIRALARRLLLTTADSPIGEKHRSLLTIRMEELLQAGMVGEAGALAAMAQLKNDPDFAQVQADALLYAGRKDDACGPLTETRLTNAAPFWLELRAYCYAVQGDDPALELTRAAMAAQGLDDKGFDILLNDAIGGGAKDFGKIETPTSLDVFLMQQVGLPVRQDVAAKLGTPAELVAMREKKNSPEDRLAAAARALQAGAASIYDLVQVAEVQKFSGDQLAHASSVAPTLSFLKGQALLYQAIAAEKDADAKERLVATALELGNKDGLLQVAANMEVNAVTAPSDKSLNSDAPLMARAAMLAGKPEVAEAWIAVIDSDQNEAEASALLAVLDLMATDPGRDARTQAALNWLAGQNDARSALTLGVYNAIGATTPLEAKNAAASFAAQSWPGRRPAQDELRRLDAALSDPTRKGEAVLTILDIMGKTGTRDLAPDVTIAMLQALEREGLGDVARSLGIEALLAFQPSATQ